MVRMMNTIRTSLGSLLLLLTTALLPTLVPTLAMGQNGGKSAEVRRLESQRKALQAEIARVSGLLTETSTTVRQSMQQLKLLEGQIDTRQKVINTLNAELTEAEQNIGRIEEDISKLLAELERRQESYVKSLRALQRGDQMKEQLLFILSAKDFAQGVRRARYLKEYASWQKKEGEKLKEIRQDLDKELANLEQQRAEKQQLLSSRQLEQAKIEEDRKAVSNALRKLQGQQQELQKELAQQRRRANQLNKQIEAQIAKEIREAEEARKRAEMAKGGKTPKRKAEVKGGYAMTDEELKLAGSFAQNKGKLPAPITGPYSITRRFGVQTHSGLHHVRVDNNGIDLQGGSNAEARAVFDGEVTAIFVMEGYNNSIIVRHGNYLTVYSNLTTVYVSKGSKVKTGQSLGKIYSDPELGGATELHFQVWKERTKLNPELWLR